MTEVGKNVRNQSKYLKSDKIKGVRKISGINKMSGFKQNVRNQPNVRIGTKCQQSNKVSGVVQDVRSCKTKKGGKVRSWTRCQ